MQAPGRLPLKMVACIFLHLCLWVGGVGNYMYANIKKGLGVHLATEKNFPYYLTRYFRCQVADWLVTNGQKVMMTIKDYLRQAYGVSVEEAQTFFLQALLPEYTG